MPNDETEFGHPFWVKKLVECRNGGPNGRHNAELKLLAEQVLYEYGKKDSSLASLAAEFLFRCGRQFKRADCQCSVLSIGYFNALDDDADSLLAFLSDQLPFIYWVWPNPFKVLLKVIRAHLEEEKIEKSIDARHLIRIWHNTMHLDSSKELNKSIARNLIAILRITGPSLIELCNHFIFRLPAQARYKYLFLFYLLDNIAVEQLDESTLGRCLEDLTRCHEGRGWEAPVADTFRSLAQKCVESGRSEVLVDLLIKCLSGDITIRQGVVRLWFPKLGSSLQLRHIFPILLGHFRLQLRSFPSPNFSVSPSHCFWYRDDGQDSCIRWSGAEIQLWAYLNLLKWTLKSQKGFRLTVADQVIWRSLLGSTNMREEIRQTVAECLGPVLFGSGHKSCHDDGGDLHQFLSDGLLRVEEPQFRRSLISLVVDLLNSDGHLELKQWLVHSIESRLDGADPLDECTGNFLHLLEAATANAGPGILMTSQLKLPKFLLRCLVFPDDSSIRERSAQLAFRLMRNSKEFQTELIALFNSLAEKKMGFTAAPLYELLQKMGIGDGRLRTEYLHRDGEEGVFLLFKLLRTKHTPLENALAREFLGECLEVNERLLRLGGSGAVAECLSVSALHSHFECGNEEDEMGMEKSLFWTSEQKKQLLRYSNGLIHSCSAIRWLVTCERVQLGEEDIRRGLQSLWMVLLRSQHKGVMEHCGADFCFAVEHFGRIHWPQFEQTIRALVDRTLSLLSRGGGQCRNIAFAKIFVPIAGSCEAMQRQELVRRLIGLCCKTNEENASTNIQMHILFLLRHLLKSAKLDLSQLHAELLEFVLRAIPVGNHFDERSSGQAKRWQRFTSAGHAFVALVHSVFLPFPPQIPFNNFFASESRFCEILLAQLKLVRNRMEQCRHSEPSLSLLLSPLQRLFVAEFPFENDSLADEFCVELVAQLDCLRRLEPSLLIRRQLMEVCANFANANTDLATF